MAQQTHKQRPTNTDKARRMAEETQEAETAAIVRRARRVSRRARYLTRKADAFLMEWHGIEGK